MNQKRTNTVLLCETKRNYRMVIIFFGSSKGLKCFWVSKRKKKETEVTQICFNAEAIRLRLFVNIICNTLACSLWSRFKDLVLLQAYLFLCWYSGC